MGVIAFVRQSFLDAQHQQLATAALRAVEDRHGAADLRSRRSTRCSRRSRPLPVAFEADQAREILRALDMAKEFKLDPIITGAREADQVAADLKARNARVIYSLNYPGPVAGAGAGRRRAGARAARARERAEACRPRSRRPGVPFAFSSGGLREPRDFVRNAAQRGQGGPARGRRDPRADDRRREDRRRRRPRSARSRRARSPTSSSPTAICSRSRPGSATSSSMGGRSTSTSRRRRGGVEEGEGLESRILDPKSRTPERGTVTSVTPIKGDCPL